LNHFPHGFTNIFFFEKFNARISKSRHSFYFEILKDYTPRDKNAQQSKHTPCELAFAMQRRNMINYL
jgi:hypothetical protein